MSIFKYLQEMLITEINRTTDYLVNVPKFKSISKNVFSAMSDIGFDKLNNGGYNEWILNQYLKMDNNAKKRFIKDNDIQQVFDALKVFHEKKNKGFFKDPKDINQYKSIADLYEISDKYKDETSKGDLKVKSSQVKDEDIEKVYENHKWAIYIPKTKEASCKLGRDTKWCTASQGKRNKYDFYTANGPLYIFINKFDSKEKYQYHQHSKQFMNKYDEDIFIDIKLMQELMIEDELFDFCKNIMTLPIEVGILAMDYDYTYKSILLGELPTYLDPLEDDDYIRIYNKITDPKLKLLYSNTFNLVKSCMTLNKKEAVQILSSNIVPMSGELLQMCVYSFPSLTEKLLDMYNKYHSDPISSVHVITEYINTATAMGDFSISTFKKLLNMVKPKDGKFYKEEIDIMKYRHSVMSHPQSSQIFNLLYDYIDENNLKLISHDEDDD